MYAEETCNYTLRDNLSSRYEGDGECWVQISLFRVRARGCWPRMGGKCIYNGITLSVLRFSEVVCSNEVVVFSMRESDEHSNFISISVELHCNQRCRMGADYGEGSGGHCPSRGKYWNQKSFPSGNACWRHWMNKREIVSKVLNESLNSLK